MSELHSKTPSVKILEETEEWNRSPFVQGFIAGTKGLLLGAPAGALIAAARGKSPLLGAAVGGIGTGLIAAAAKSAEQDLKNQQYEAALRYHAERLKSREPLFFLPPPHQLGRLFSRFHSQAHEGHA